MKKAMPFLEESPIYHIMTIRNWAYISLKSDELWQEVKVSQLQ